MERGDVQVVLLLCAVFGPLGPFGCKQRATVDHQPPPEVTNARPTSATSGPRVPAKVLASTEESSDRIVADDTEVFWTTRSVEERFAPESDLHTGHIMSCPVTGCGVGGPTLVAAAQSHVDALALDAKHIYWTRRGFHGAPSDILKCPRTGCVTPQTVHAHLYQGHPQGGGPSALAVDEGGIFWIDYEERAIDRCPIEGCGAAPPQVLAKVSAHPGSLTLAQGVAYWTNEDGSIMKCAERGCDSKPTTVGEAAGQPSDIVVDGARVVWINHRMGPDVEGGHVSEILACPAGGCAGAPKALVATGSSVSALASYAGRLYWTERGGPEGDVVRTCSAEHCVPASVVTGVQADGLAVSGAGLFWTEARAHQIQTLPLSVVPQ